MKPKAIKFFVILVSFVITYLLISHYYPIFLKSLSPLFQMMYFILLLTIWGLSSAFIMAIESGFNWRTEQKAPKNNRNPGFVIYEWLILFPIKIFVFTFVIYLVYSFYSGFYTELYNDPSVIKGMRLRMLAVVFAPPFAVVTYIICGIYSLFVKKGKYTEA